jgi:hypothetical protein
MNRRKFIEKSGVGFAAFLPVSCLQVASKYKIGYQLYSYTDEMARDPLNTLKYLRDRLSRF